MTPSPRTLVTVTCIYCRDEFTAETFRLARAMHDLHTCRRTPFLGPPSARSGNLSDRIIRMGRGSGKDALLSIPDTAADDAPVDAQAAEEQP